MIGFDINSLASLFAELKFNALRKLDFENFKKYFFVGNSKTMDFEVYNSINILVMKVMICCYEDFHFNSTSYLFSLN